MKNKLLIIVFLTIAGVPLMAGLLYSAMYSLGLTGILSKGFTVRHIETALSTGSLISSLLYSLYVATMVILLTCFIALSLIYFIRKYRQGQIPVFFFLPLAVPYIVMAFLSFQFLSQSGTLSRLIFHAGILDNLQQFPVLVNDEAGFSIIFSHVFLAVPFFTILFGRIYQNERLQELEELSRTLGASGFRTFTGVTAPVLLLRSYPTFALYFIVFLGSYEIPLLLGVQSPEMISVFVVRKLQRFNLMDIPQAYIAATFYALLVLCLLVLIYIKSSGREQRRV